MSKILLNYSSKHELIGRGSAAQGDASPAIEQFRILPFSSFSKPGDGNIYIFNRPGVAGAVLQIPPLLIN